MTSSMRQVPPHPVIIQGSKGEIRLTGMACCPDGFVLKLHGEKEETFHYGQPEKGNGLVSFPHSRCVGTPSFNHSPILSRFSPPLTVL
jgi:hypothetical protein